MTVVHNHQHPRAMEVLTPTNPEIAKKFGQVRVEDWDDRVAGFTAAERSQRGTSPSITIYESLRGRLDRQQELGSADINEIVRCHTTNSGEMVLLHNDWL